MIAPGWESRISKFPVCQARTGRFDLNLPVVGWAERGYFYALDYDREYRTLIAISSEISVRVEIYYNSSNRNTVVQYYIVSVPFSGDFGTKEYADVGRVFLANSSASYIYDGSTSGRATFLSLGKTYDFSEVVCFLQSVLETL